MDCRFVAQSQQTPMARLISGWEGDQAVSAGSAVGGMELEDPSGIRVAATFVAAESQAVSIVPWLLEGDRLQVVGTVVIRLDRQSARPAWAFRAHEIQRSAVKGWGTQRQRCPRHGVSSQRRANSVATSRLGNAWTWIGRPCGWRCCNSCSLSGEDVTTTSRCGPPDHQHEVRLIGDGVGT